MEQELTVNKKSYRIVRLLGKGKGGYSYLAECDGQQAVIKQIHHEPCDYYTFGNKIEAELRDYARLQKAGIRIPGRYGFPAEGPFVSANLPDVIAGWFVPCRPVIISPAEAFRRTFFVSSF